MRASTLGAFTKPMEFCEPFFNIGGYSPLWKMDGGITPTIGPGAPCGNTATRVFIRSAEPGSVDAVKATGLPVVNGIFRDIDCPILATDVDDDGTFESGELVRFADVAW